jgi:hypothetical protein
LDVVERSDDPAGGADTARNEAGESDSSLELSIEGFIHSIRPRNPDPTPHMTKEEEDQKWAKIAGRVRSDRSPSSGRKQEGTGEMVEATNDGSTRPNLEVLTRIGGWRTDWTFGKGTQTLNWRVPAGTAARSRRVERVLLAVALAWIELTTEGQIALMGALARTRVRRLGRLVPGGSLGMN